MTRAKLSAALIVTAAAGLAWQALAQTPRPGEVHAGGDASQRVRSSLGRGYFETGPLAGSLSWSPPPPAPGSPAEQRDLEAAKNAVSLRNSARWNLAVRDADLGPQASDAFSCAAGVNIGPDTTPKVEHLLRRSMANLAFSTQAIKNQYKRARPFTVNGEPVCTPEMEKQLRGDGSYPSGHSAIGFGWSLILAELLPDRAAQLVTRGRAFGDSRRVCNAHWLSDTEEGRIAASAMVARLHAEKAFRADLEAARKELSRPLPPPRECARGKAALSGHR